MDRAWTILILLLVAPAATAGSPEAPELSDGAGDVYIQNADAAAVPYADGSDLRAAWLTDDAEGLHLSFRVEDLAALSFTDAGNADTMFFLRFETDYIDPQGAANRQGDWMLRADYQPLNGEAWRFWIERPCLDGNEDDGCAGADRDIIDGLTGSVDEPSNTLTVHAPWSVLADPQPGDGIVNLRASSQMVWPTWPVYAIDWDTDEADQCYAFQTHPDDRIDVPLGTRPSGSGTNGASVQQGTGGVQCQRPTAPSTVEDPVGIDANQTHKPVANETGADDPPAEEAPVATLPLLAAVLLLAARRRQNP